ncbi:MAG: hypothetical protein JO129_02115 [Candidatus Dependentiae bacterium]|nr:hypothetical protein [Candidatus Dependentiae bacterium]
MKFLKYKIIVVIAMLPITSLEAMSTSSTPFSNYSRLYDTSSFLGKQFEYKKATKENPLPETDIKIPEAQQKTIIEEQHRKEQIAQQEHQTSNKNIIQSPQQVPPTPLNDLPTEINLYPKNEIAIILSEQTAEQNNQLPFIYSADSSIPIESEQVPSIDNNLDLPDKANPEIENKSTSSYQFAKDKANQFATNTSKGLSIVSQEAFQIPEQVANTFIKFFDKMIITFVKHHLPQQHNAFKVTVAEVVAASIKKMMFNVFNLSESLGPNTDNSINNFKMQLQYLAQQIEIYNNTNIYTNPDQMLLLIQSINQFLKENNVMHVSQQMYKKLDAIANLATITTNIFRNQNIIFSSIDAPAKVFACFQPIINTTNNLSKAQYSYDLMQTIYGTNGYIDQIMETWNKFQSNELYKTPINRQYGAFLTFLLLFENSIVAAAIILDQTSSLYKVVNPIPVVINIA